MPKPHEKLASALEALKGFQEGGLQAIPGLKLSRADREALLRAGFLKEVIRGWYIPRWSATIILSGVATIILAGGEESKAA